MSKQLSIGLFGFGCVGQGLYDVLSNSVEFKTDFKKICIKHPNKERILDQKLFTTNKWDILYDKDIDTIVELIDDAEEAYQIITDALKRGKNVVTANKKVVAEHLVELIHLQKEYNVSLIYEASACGGIPIIRTLEEYYDNEELSAVSGIFNGSSNFILTKIYKENLSYQEALRQAQELGFAETDPTLDVEGFDPKYKLIILALHAFGVILQPSKVYNSGISNIGIAEKNLFDETGVQVKLNPVLKKWGDKDLVGFVLPQLITASHPLYNVNNEYNAVVVEGVFSNEQLFIGKGAGGHPTGSAVLSDISALSYDYKYSYKKYYQHKQLHHNNQVSLNLYIRGTKESLLYFAEGADVREVEQGAVIIVERTIEWLLENQNQLQKQGVFVAQLHPNALYIVNEWVNAYSKHAELV